MGGFSRPNEQPVLVEDLGTGGVSIRVLPGTERGGDRLSLLSVGGFVVYWTTGVVSAVPSTLKGRVRRLGQATSVAPASTTGEVWLVRSPYPYSEASVESVSVASGSHGPLLALPPRTYLLRGTDAGLLLETQRGELELWRPGDTPRMVADIGPALDHVFATGARTVAFGTGCRYVKAGPSDYEYTMCSTLRVVDLVTGRRVSFAAPPDTVGWVPPPTTEANLSQKGRELAAEGAIPPTRRNRTELFVLSLSGRQHPVMPVPTSVAHEYVRAAWTPSGSALLYEGPQSRLDVFIPEDGKRYQSRLPWNRTSGSVVAVPKSDR